MATGKHVTLRRRDATDPNVIKLGTGRTHVLTLLEPRGHFLEFDDVFFSFNSTALLPESKDHTPVTPEGDPITGLNLCLAVLQYAEQFGGEKSLLVLGHTDTVGSDDENVTLSRLRAQVVHALIDGKREAFKEAVDAPHITDKQQKANTLIHDKNFVLDWIADYTDWPCSLKDNHNNHWAATKQLQASYNEHGSEYGGEGEQLDVDGDFGPLTWGAVFDVYQDYLARALEIDHAELRARQDALVYANAGTTFAGCGEFHPVARLGDGMRSETNRRVEVNFFDLAEVPQLECFTGGCAGRACELYDPLRFRRTPLPPSWKYPWKVGWERPNEAATLGERRGIVLQAPKLAEGAEVTITVTLEVEGRRVVLASLPTLALAEAARVEFGGWYDPDTVQFAAQPLEPDQPFPIVRFHVSAQAEGRSVDGRRPLVYADRLEAEVQHELVQAEFDAEHVEAAECLVYSPWGVKRAMIDDEGLLIVEGLPPGGVMVTIDGDPYFAEGQGLA